MKIKDFFKSQWQLYTVQIVGAGLLIPAFALAVIAARSGNINLAYTAWIVLAVIGILDLYIIREAKQKDIQTVTITRWIRNLLPKKADNVIMFGFIGVVWWLAGPLYALFYMHGFLNDHFNENRD